MAAPTTLTEIGSPNKQSSTQSIYISKEREWDYWHGPESGPHG